MQGYSKKVAVYKLERVLTKTMTMPETYLRLSASVVGRSKCLLFKPPGMVA